MAHYSVTDLNWDGLKGLTVVKRRKAELSNGWTSIPEPIVGVEEPPNQTIGEIEPNIEFTYLQVSMSNTTDNNGYVNMKLKMITNPDQEHAVCFVKFKGKFQSYAGDPDTMDVYTILSKSSPTHASLSNAYVILSPTMENIPTDNGVGISEYVVDTRFPLTIDGRNNKYFGYGNSLPATYYGTYTEGNFPTFGYPIESTLSAFVSTTRMADTSIPEWNKLELHSKNATTTDGHYIVPYVFSSYAYVRQNVFPFYTSSTPSTYSRLYMWALTKLPEDIPIFDLENGADKIINYLDNGDDSGRVDPFTPPTPTKELIDDFKTNYRIFLSPYEANKDLTHFSVIAYNNQYINYYETLNAYYKLSVEEQRYKDPSFSLIQSNGQAPYPTVGFFNNQNATNTGGYYYLRLRFHEQDEPITGEKTSPLTVVSLKYKEDSIVNCTVDGASSSGKNGTRTSVVDGYRYTFDDGHWVEILFRAVDLDDLDVKYSDPDDEENEQTGSDVIFSGANGLHTFVVNNTDFGTINDKLWSTDWTNVFKSSSIDPIKCVIACKSIPFSASALGSSDVIIANMNTGVHANYVNTVKSFDVGNVLMPHYNNDFTDITLTHIRCYLPYIGWVELPANECISRVSYPRVGVTAKPKRLKFKYIVDFVDGAVRCIISVNGTERWIFDGNCSIDLPLTSDNHTQAVSNAIRSGVATGISVISAVVGAYTGNAGAVAGGVVGAVQNAPNIIPTYSYTATANGSGYINASMNTHIMIIIERPNTQRSTDYSKRLGIPCGLSLPLSSLSGFTKCSNVDLSNINATPNELSMIKSLLENGVYL